MPMPKGWGTENQAFSFLKWDLKQITPYQVLCLHLLTGWSHKWWKELKYGRSGITDTFAGTIILLIITNIWISVRGKRRAFLLASCWKSLEGSTHTRWRTCEIANEVQPLLNQSNNFFSRYAVIEINCVNKRNVPTITSEYTSDLCAVTTKPKSIRMEPNRKIIALLLIWPLSEYHV